MRVLIAYGTKMGGTAGIAEIVGDARRFVKRNAAALRGAGAGLDEQEP